MYSFANLPSSQTISELEACADYGAPMELNQRIFKARSDAKMTQEELAKAVGKTRGAVAQWESGEVRPRHSAIVQIAAATNKSLTWLLQGGDDSGAMVGLTVIGEVAAGEWKEGTVYFRQTSEPVAAHPGYPAFAQRLYRVRGTSINRIASDGEFLHAVDIKAADIKPEHGDLVVVRRMQHGLAEYTAKQLVYADGRWVLRPESNDPDWQQDIQIEADDGIEIEVTDIVIAKWSPIARRRQATVNTYDPFQGST